MVLVTLSILCIWARLYIVSSLALYGVIVTRHSLVGQSLHIYGGSTEIILCFYMRDWCFVHPSSHFHYIFLFKFLSTRFLEKLRYTHTRSKTHITVPRDSSTRCTRVLLCSYSSLFTNSTNYTTVASTKVCFLSPYKHTCYFLPWFIIVSKKTNVSSIRSSVITMPNKNARKHTLVLISVI